MKLLFDENLSPKLPRAVASFFPGSEHVEDRRLRGVPDKGIWEYARTGGFAIVTKDTDFEQLGRVYGPPSKVVLLTLGNCTWQQSAQLLISRRADVLALDEHPLAVVLRLP